MVHVLLGRKSCLGVCPSNTYEADSKISALFNAYFYAGVLTFPKTEEPSTNSRCQNGYLIPF